MDALDKRPLRQSPHAGRISASINAQQRRKLYELVSAVRADHRRAIELINQQKRLQFPGYTDDFCLAVDPYQDCKQLSVHLAAMLRQHRLTAQLTWELVWLEPSTGSRLPLPNGVPGEWGYHCAIMFEDCTTADPLLERVFASLLAFKREFTGKHRVSIWFGWGKKRRKAGSVT